MTQHITMHPHTESGIRKSFINCSKGAASRLNLPKNFPDIVWEDQIFLSWRDPRAPQSAYLVVEDREGEGLRGIVLQKNSQKGSGGAQMCQLCMTLHPGSGVSLFTIQCGRTAKDRYNTIGTYLCSDLACSDYVYNRRKPSGVRQMEETLTPAQKAERTKENALGLVDRVQARIG